MHNDRSQSVCIFDGAVYCRNRRHLLKTNEQFPDIQCQDFPPNHWIQYFKSTPWYPTRGTQTRATPHWPVWSTISKMSNRNTKLYFLFWECGKTKEICRNHVKLFVQVLKTLHVCVYDLKKSIKMYLNFACINVILYKYRI